MSWWFTREGHHRFACGTTGGRSDNFHLLPLSSSVLIGSCPSGTARVGQAFHSVPTALRARQSPPVWSLPSAVCSYEARKPCAFSSLKLLDKLLTAQWVLANAGLSRAWMISAHSSPSHFNHHTCRRKGSCTRVGRKIAWIVMGI